MKLVPLCALLLLTAGSAFAAEPVIEFRGVTTGDGAMKLSLVDKTTDTVRWVEIGQVFLGFTVKAYDAKTETATLSRMGKEYRIRINTSKIEEAPAGFTSASAASAAKISNETARTIFMHLQQISAAADQYYLENGKSSVTLDELVGPTKYIRELKPEAGEDYRNLRLVAGNNPLAVTTASGETIIWDSGGNSSTFYRIRAGDTLATIAKRFGTSPAQLAMLNDAVDPARLQAGQLLRTK